MPPANAPVSAMRPPARTVHNALSDIFFNRDNDAARRLEGDRFVGWDVDKLNEEAQSLLDCLAELGVEGLPTAAVLVEDFIDRC